MTFDADHRPVQCGPCSKKREAAAVESIGWVPECYSCTAVLTVAEYEARATLPPAVRAYGILCAECAESVRRKIA
ncbi:hypothetical protein ACFV0D_12615 [Streptomyces sp. NPDC059556]|uniref:hypothetical protein n=1 Tax=Streptomyces sp. NPDC059556 TaxID=3346863 RepID=UPI0036C8BE1A